MKETEETLKDLLKEQEDAKEMFVMEQILNLFTRFNLRPDQAIFITTKLTATQIITSYECGLMKEGTDVNAFMDGLCDIMKMLVKNHTKPKGPSIPKDAD